MKHQERLLLWPELYGMVRLGRSTIWRMEREGSFPKRRLISNTRIGWIESEVLTWIASREQVNGESQS